MIFVKIMQHFIGKPFKAGGFGQGGGFDCLGFVVAFQAMRGINMPRHFAQYDEQNYSELYLNDREKAEDILIEYLNSFAMQIDIKHILAGDIILFKSDKDQLRFVAIYLGNNQYASSFINHGVQIFGLDDKTIPILAWRVK